MQLSLLFTFTGPEMAQRSLWCRLACQILWELILIQEVRAQKSFPLGKRDHLWGKQGADGFFQGYWITALVGTRRDHGDTGQVSVRLSIHELKEFFTVVEQPCTAHQNGFQRPGKDKPGDTLLVPLDVSWRPERNNQLVGRSGASVPLAHWLHSPSFPAHRRISPFLLFLLPSLPLSYNQPENRFQV